MPAETLEQTESQETSQRPPSLSGWMNSLPAIEEAPAAETQDRTEEVAPEPPVKPAEKPVAAKPETPAAEKPAAEAAEEKWPRSAKDWDAFRTARKAEKEALAAEAKAAKDERDRIKAELEEARKAPAAPSDYEDTKKRLDEAERILKAVHVEKHPKFQAYFKGKFDQQYGLAKTIVGSEHAAQIEKILKINDPEVRDRQFEDFTSTLSTVQQARLGNILNNVTAIEMERAGELERASQSYDEMTKAEQTRLQTETKARQDAYTKAFDSEIAAAQDPTKGLPIFQKRDGDADWNKQVDSLVESSKNVLMAGNKMSPADAARAAMYAASFPGLLKWSNAQISTKDTEIAKLTEQVKRLTGSEPSLKGGERPAGEQRAQIQHKAHASPADATKNWMAGITQDWRK